MNWLRQNKDLLSISLLFWVMMLVFMPKEGHGWDNWCWADWAQQIRDRGLGHIYEGSCNYLPAYLYILKIHSWIFGMDSGIHEKIYVLKYYTLLFDLAGVLLVLAVVNKPERKWMNWAFLALNFSFLYNTVAWGQIDAIHSFFIFAGIVLLHQGKLLWGTLLCLLSLNFKLQGIVFFPVALLAAWPHLGKQNLRQWMQLILIPVLLQMLILYPFLAAGNGRGLWNVIKGSVGYFPYVSMNAFNFWYFFYPAGTDLTKVSDLSTVAGLSLKNWGMFLFFLFSGLVLLFQYGKPLWDSLRRKTAEWPGADALLLTGALVSLLFFWLPTEMHERYSHPAWLFIAAYSFRTLKLWPLLLFSFAYFINMEKVLMFLKLRNYGTFVFSEQLAAALFGILIIGLLREAFRRQRALPVREES